MKNIDFVEVTRENVVEAGVYCIKNPKAEGYKAKLNWFRKQAKNGLKIILAIDTITDKQLGFIEYIDSESAWRPIAAKNYLFIQCIALFGKGYRAKGIASEFVNLCELEANRQNKSGVCTMSSDGPWMANKTLFEKAGFKVADELDRFELMYKTVKKENPKPRLIDWTAQQRKYKGWNLVYSDQCPWHEKAIEALSESASEHGLELRINKLTTPRQAQKAPSGFGTFSLINDGKLLADHYISKTRFENILKKRIEPLEIN